MTTELKWVWNSLPSPSFSKLFEPENRMFEITKDFKTLRYEPKSKEIEEEEEEDQEEVECGVCLNKIEEGELIKELRCEHMFHRACLDKWLSYRNSTCPNCRESLVPRKAVTELGVEVLTLKFSSALSSDDRDRWWLR